ncbi:hypothetical protein [Kribbella sindirgiensis]|uniref:Uncharacterized protein n=1 Tax=Kribbella sindirgiensis TaxID=1124744 RepID=A0A4R0IQR3_9ACTN|nr:hypothetical protein [Kribbella sindirgiensis]TCC34940.1 hypothetical protein E0H50_13700 [Kribbella sindirgiensis]
MEKPPQKTTAREVVEATVEGAAGMIPVVGSPLAVAFAVAMGWTHNKRMTQWFEDLADTVTELQEQGSGLTFDQLADDPIFTDAVINATRAAQATHQQEKLDALRNGVLNSLGPGAPSVDEQSRFFRLVDEFGVAHLTMLTFPHNPRGWFDDRGLQQETYMMGGRGLRTPSAKSATRTCTRSDGLGGAR